nr:hypothetical protein [Candidatus Sigynarchaeota archaeon]
METEFSFSVDDWERRRSFSSYSSYILPDTEKKPENATRRGNSWVPRSPDGFTIGNSKMFAAIGVPIMDIEHIHEFYTTEDFSIPFIKDFNVARLTHLVGPDKKTVHLQNLPNVFKVQDFNIMYAVDGETCFYPAANAMYQEGKR